MSFRNQKLTYGQEGRYALPQHEFGLDVIALADCLRYAEHGSIPEIHQRLSARGQVVCERAITNLLDRYDELLAVTLTDNRRLKDLLTEQGRVLQAIDGLLSGRPRPSTRPTATPGRSRRNGSGGAAP